MILSVIRAISYKHRLRLGLLAVEVACTTIEFPLCQLRRIHQVLHILNQMNSMEALAGKPIKDLLGAA